MCRPPAVTALTRDLVGSASGTGVDTSAGLLFNHSLWARDRVITALDLLDQDPEIGVGTVRALAALQGTRRRRLSGEEPGRIHNERRDLLEWCAPWWLKTLFGAVISPMWGGTPAGYVSYFASDSTPLYVILVAELAERDPSVLDIVVDGKGGRRLSVRDSVDAAVRWIESHLSDDGLIELRQHNILSLQQGWKDGPTSNYDEHGRMPNVVERMAYLDVQALAGEALRRAAPLGTTRPPQRLLDEARLIRDATLLHFWMPERAYFGHAIDRGADGARRLLRSVQSDAGWMLATGFFDDLPDEERARYVGGIVRMLFSPELLTIAGVRGRALSDHNPGFRNYHENVWPMDTNMIARGLRRQGLPELADQLEDRLLNTANMLGGAFEFVAVDHEGRVIDPLLTADEARRYFRRQARAVPTEMMSEEPMGWTLTALLAIKRRKARRARDGRAARSPSAAWLAELTAEILGSIEQVTACGTRAELRERLLPLSPSFLAHGTGLRRAFFTVLFEAFGVVIPRSLATIGRHPPDGQAAGSAGREPGEPENVGHSPLPLRDPGSATAA